MRHMNRTIAYTVSALMCHSFFSHLMSAPGCMWSCVRLTTSVITVYYCFGTLRKKQFSIFLNYEMNESTRRKKLNYGFFFFFMLFFYFFGGESVKQVPVNKFVWPNTVKALLLRLFSFNVIINDVPAVSLGQPNLSREQGHQLYIRATSSALLVAQWATTS